MDVKADMGLRCPHFPKTSFCITQPKMITHLSGTGFKLKKGNDQCYGMYFEAQYGSRHAKTSLRASMQSDQSFHCPLTESLDT